MSERDPSDAASDAEEAGDDFVDDFETDVAVRYTDVDTYGHVNNAVYATYLEEARIDFLRDALGDAGDEDALTGGDGEGVGMVVANLEIDYRAPLGHVEAVTVAVRVPDLGTSSFPIEYAVRSDGRTLAVGETTMVAYDRAAGEPRPLPDDWREALASVAES